MADVFRSLTPEEIQRMANSPDDEETVLQMIGLKPYQIKLAKRTEKWINNWAFGKAKWRSLMNKKLEESTDASIQRLLAEHSLPKQDTIDDGYEFEIDAPKWFLKGLKNAKNIKT